MTPAPAEYADRCRAAVEAEGLPFLAPLVGASQGPLDFVKLTREAEKAKMAISAPAEPEKAPGPVEVLVPELPAQLRTAELRFIVLPKGKKGGGNELGWQTTANYSHDDPRLIAHIAAGGNVGAFPAAGSGIVILDADEADRLDELIALPQTFEVETGGSTAERRKVHRYYRVEPGTVEGKHVLADSAGLHLGELYTQHPESAKGYCVVPPSIHPSGNPYQVAADRAMAELPAETVAALMALAPEAKRSAAPATESKPAQAVLPGRGGTISERLGLRVTDFLMPLNARQRDGEWEGVHPVHGSDTGTNYTCDHDKWFCRRHQTGGGPLEAFAVARGIITCEDCRPGCLKDPEVWAKVMDGLRAEGFDVDGATADRERDRLRAKAPAPATPATAAKEEELARVCAGFNATDTGNGDRFAARYVGEVLYCEPRKMWYRYGEGVWVPDRVGAVRQMAKRAAVSINREAAVTPNDARRRELQKWAKESESQYRLRSMVESASSDPRIAVLPEAFDADPDLFNVRNGTLDLRTLEIRPHRREDRLTKMAGCDFDPAADCPKWRAHMDLIFDGDQELIDSTQELLGYGLITGNPEQIFPIWWGSGQNGKSVTLAVVREIYGDYAATAAPETFMDQGRDGGPRPDLLKLRNARLVTAAEARKGQRLNEPLIKQMTGGEKIVARGLYQDQEEFLPSHLTILMTNPRPVITGTEYAIWRRVLMWPFAVTIPADRRIPDYEKVLLEEAPGILNWMLEGLRRYQDRGRLAIPEKVRAATEQYRTEQDILAPFIRYRCVLAQGEHTDRKSLYDEYEAFCRGNDEEPMSKNQFASALKERGVVDGGAVKGKRRWKGVRIKSVDELRADEEAGSVQDRL